MEAKSLNSDIGLVSPKWLQSDDSFSFDTLGNIDALMADLPDFAAMSPCPSHFSAMPTFTCPLIKFGAAPPRPSVLLQQLMVMNCSDYKTKTPKNQQIHW